jgi:glycosyltransferase involved in cell wall biosynthesis
MRIGIYDPYLDTLGGGERYILSIASFFSQDNNVEIFWDDASLLEKVNEKLHIDIQTIRITQNIFKAHISLLKRLSLLKNYDILIFLSDGSIPVLSAKKNFVIIQHPVNWVRNGFLNKIKLLRVNDVIVYSNFVKRFIDTSFGVESIVLAPPVPLLNYDEQKKENIILSVGRFTKGMNTKKQEEMLRIFQKMCDNGLKDWELVLIGSSLEQDYDFVLRLKEEIHGYPINVLQNADYKTLVQYYEKAKIYWHAAGYGENLDLYPERAEHFGITTVEAMSAGAVPIVINAGGQKEIVTEQENGFLWNDEEELIAKTKLVIEDDGLRTKLAKETAKSSTKYSVESFHEKLKKIVQ